MGFLARLVMFGAIVAAVGVVGKLVNGTLFGNNDREVRVERTSSRSSRADARRARAEPPAPPEAPDAPEILSPEEIRAIVEPAERLAQQAIRDSRVAMAVAADAEVRAKDRRAEAIRIVSTNGATFLSVRHNDIVAGLSDSIRLHIATSMNDEREKKDGSSKLGEMIASTVMSSVQKLVGKEIVVPIESLSSADLDGNRIVFEYRDGKPNGVMNLENMKFDDKGDFLEQFSSRDAKRFVSVVKTRIKDGKR